MMPSKMRAKASERDRLERELADYGRSLPVAGRGGLRFRPDVKLDPSQIEDRRPVAQGLERSVAEVQARRTTKRKRL